MQKIKSPYEKSLNKFALKAATELLNEIRLSEPKSDSKLDLKTGYENWIQKLIRFENRIRNQIRKSNSKISNSKKSN